MKIKDIGNIPISHDRPFLIAEAGVNHEGSLERAMEMVDAAALAGADMIKFQSYKAGTLASKNSPAYWDRSKEPADSQYALFKRHDALEIEDYQKLKIRCDEKGILFLTTPFDASFVDALDDLLLTYKIASADITNTVLLKGIAAKQKPVILSTGASFVGEIETAVNLLKGHGVPGIGLLHCILEYPTKPEHAHLQAMTHLAEIFPDVSIGWSDHVPPEHGCLSLLTAWMLGATILEKHFTLDKTSPGNDHYHAMDPDDILLFRKQQAHMQELLGSKQKTVFDCEQAARKHARRSLVATIRIPAKTPIEPHMLMPKRPGSGIAPKYLDLLIGKKPMIDIDQDQVLTWDAFLS